MQKICMKGRRTALSLRKTVTCPHTLVALASEAYLKVADCESDEGVAASHYVEAANCMKRINTSEAVQIMQRAIQCYCTTGSIRMVRLVERVGGEVCEAGG